MIHYLRVGAHNNIGYVKNIRKNNIVIFHYKIKKVGPTPIKLKIGFQNLIVRLYG